MRNFFLALLFVCLLALASATTPDDGSTNLDEMCELDGLSFTNGLVLIGAFSPNKFHYTCSCANWGSGDYTTTAKPHMMDPGSSAEVKLNGVTINSKAGNNAISNGGADGVAPNSPLKESSPLVFKEGTNVIIIGVSCNGRGQPSPCYYEYQISCDKPGQGGSVVGDPQFVGLRGQSYQVHGVSGEIYNIVSDQDLQYNSRFVFLDHGECPIVDGKKQKGCFSHPGSYLGELGLKTRSGDKIHVVTGSAKAGFASIEVNGQQVAEGETVLLQDGLGSISRNNTHVASMQIGNWDFVFENSDHYLNQRVRVLDSRNLRSHGLLGQTWRDTTYPNAIKFIQGQVDDYVIRGRDLFGDNFVYNTFN
jgi:hypothetical protein